MAKIKLELMPLTVPEYVFIKMPVGKRQDGVKELPRYAIADLDAETLDELCKEFRIALFAKMNDSKKSDSNSTSCPAARDWFRQDGQD